MAIVVFVFSTNAYAADIVAKGAWVRAMPSSETVTAAYMTIVNNSPNNIVLVSAASDVSSSVEIHQTSHMNGVMNMSMAVKLTIPSGGKLALKPNGFHLMLVGLFKTLQKGDTATITLRFLNGQDVTIKAHVR
jgi:copper(I)-binding protein